MLATPDSFRPNQSPLGAYHPAPGSHFRRRAPSPELPFDGSGVVMLSSTFVDSRSTAFVLTESRTQIWAYLLCFIGSRPATGRQTQVCLQPLIHKAGSEPPGRLRSSTGFPYERLRRCKSTLVLASALPDCSGAFSVTVQANLGETEASSFEPSHLSLTACWTYV